MEEIRKLVRENSFFEEKKGQVISHENIENEELKEIEKWGDFSAIKPMKIVVDTANSMGITYLLPLFEKLPQLDIIYLNEDLDGSFPSHQPDPFQEENTRDLCAKVIVEKADLGIATDGDGDRIFFVDNTGKVVEPAMLRGIMARIFLRSNPGAVICYDIRPGKITEDLILENGGIPSVTRVGHSLIKEQMLKENAVFGGESSGHFFVRFPFGTFESPLIVVIKILEELSIYNGTFAQYLEPLCRYFHSGEKNYKIKDTESVFKSLKEKYHNAELNELDGLLFTYDDWWFNVRGSNTEPLVRLNLEARTEGLMREKVKEVEDVILG